MLKIGIVGCGYWGAKHIRSLFEMGECEVVACDQDTRRLHDIARRYPSIATTDRFEDLLNPDVAGLIIATPISTHYTLARAALRSGRDVLVEKPLTNDLVQAAELVNLAERENAVLMVGHTFIYNPAVGAVRQLISSGELGDICYIDSARLNLGLVQKDANVLWDLAPHDLSIILYLLGMDPTVISARGAAHLDHRTHDNAYLDLTFPNGTLAHIHVSWLEPCKVRRITIVGSRKMVVYDDIALTEKVWLYDRRVTRSHHTDKYDDFHLSYHYGNTTILHIPDDEPLQVEQREFLSCIEERRRPVSGSFLGLRVVTLLEAAQYSLRTGGERVAVGKLLTSDEADLRPRIQEMLAGRLSPGVESGDNNHPLTSQRS